MAMRLKVNKVLGPFVFTKGRDITITPDFSMKFIINLLWGDAFDEKIIVTLIETIGNEFLSDEFRWLGNEFWIEKEVNLWELKDFVGEERRREFCCLFGCCICGVASVDFKINSLINSGRW